MSGFWEKAGDFASKTAKNLEKWAQEQEKQRIRYSELAEHLSDKALIERYKKGVGSVIERTCYRQELIKRGLIKPKND